eukprot:g1665.t2
MSAYHLHTGSLVAMLCLVSFVLGSVSDPGTITKENVELMLQAFPYDNVLFTEKRCTTCEFLKPARSKHCSICKKCVAKHDHHCAWLNNCVGLNNHRYFLFFLTMNLLATLYGSIAIPLFLYGDMLRILHYPIVDPKTGQLFTLANTPWKLMEYITIRYTMLSALFFCSVIFSMLLTGFLGYHLYLITVGKTTNENFKWSDLSTAARREQTETVNWWRGPKLPVNIYNHGLISNFTEVMFPSTVYQQPVDQYSRNGRILRTSLILDVPLLMIMLHRLMLWSFELLLKWDDHRLKKLDKTFTSMLADFKDRNRYNRILELLKKYDPDEQRKQKLIEIAQNPNPVPQPPPQQKPVIAKRASFGGSLMSGAGKVVDKLANSIIGDQPELVEELE